MSFDKLQQTIFDEAKKQIGSINDQADKTFASEEARIKEKAQAVEESIIGQAEKEGQQNAQRLHQSAQLKGRAQVLRAKQEELDEVLTKAYKEIVSWDKGDTTLLINALLDLVGKEKGVISPGTAHAEVVRGLATKRGFKVTERMIEEDGGFVLKSDKTEINLSVKHLLKQLYERNRAEIARVLFV